MSDLLCRHIFVSGWVRVPCEYVSVVVWRDPASGFVHPRCGYHWRAVRAEAIARGWVEVSDDVARLGETAA